MQSTINPPTAITLINTLILRRMTHTAVHIVCNEELGETISYLLQKEGFDGTSYENGRLIAYCQTENFNKESVNAIISELNIIPEKIEEFEDQNWNQLWEDNFKESFIGKHVHARAPFHPAADVKHDIIIHPKMAFGTGHHATTQLCAIALEKLDCQNKAVLDMGCGSGILAILAAQKKAAHIVAIDYDINSVNNTEENVQLNGVKNVVIQQADNVTHLTDKFDIIVSNIIKAVNLPLIPNLLQKLNNGGRLIVSGFLDTDQDELDAAAQAQHLTLVNYNIQDNWLQGEFLFELNES